MKQNPPIFMVVWLIENQQLPTSASQRQYVYSVTQTSINWLSRVKILPHMRCSLSFHGNIKSKIWWLEYGFSGISSRIIFFGYIGNTYFLAISNVYGLKYFIFLPLVSRAIYTIRCMLQLSIPKNTKENIETTRVDTTSSHTSKSKRGGSWAAVYRNK